jgi:heme-binding protein
MKQIFRWKVIRWILLGMLLILVVIQFVPVERVNPPIEAEVPAPANVRAILRRACYDCHSNETVWPWYSQVAPFSWLLVRDVQEGRAELNFSTWNQYSTRQQVKKLKESWQEVSEGKMPPWYYLPVHRAARLAAEDRTALYHWTISLAPAPEGKSNQ